MEKDITTSTVNGSGKPFQQPDRATLAALPPERMAIFHGFICPEAFIPLFQESVYIIPMVRKPSVLGLCRILKCALLSRAFEKAGMSF